VPTIFFNATRDQATGMIFLKVVNVVGTDQAVNVQVNGVSAIDPDGEAVVLGASGPDETNSINDPTRLVPVTAKVDGLGTNFCRTFPPYSITVLKLSGK